MNIPNHLQKYIFEFLRLEDRVNFKVANNTYIFENLDNMINYNMFRYVPSINIIQNYLKSNDHVLHYMYSDCDIKEAWEFTYQCRIAKSLSYGTKHWLPRFHILNEEFEYACEGNFDGPWYYLDYYLYNEIPRVLTTLKDKISIL